MNRYLMLVASLVLLVGLMAACGDDDESPTATPQAPAATPTTAAAETPSSGGNGDGDPDAGRDLATAQCAACHSFDGSQSVGPSWQGLYGSEVELEGGETVVADEEYLHESIVDPNAKVVAGYPQGVMPSFESTLTEEQITNIIAFIRTLE